AVFLDDIGSNLKAAAAKGILTIKAAAAKGILTIKVGKETPGVALDELEQKLGFSLREFVPGTISVRPNLK
ncbi:hypothetical protein T484DRAFT_1845889, partial [Baffinella frigidus]